jgi:hypothetical protein
MCWKLFLALNLVGGFWIGATILVGIGATGSAGEKIDTIDLVLFIIIELMIIGISVASYFSGDCANM